MGHFWFKYEYQELEKLRTEDNFCLNARWGISGLNTENHEGRKNHEKGFKGLNARWGISGLNTALLIKPKAYSACCCLNARWGISGLNTDI